MATNMTVSGVMTYSFKAPLLKTKHFILVNLKMALNMAKVLRLGPMEGPLRVILLMTK
jgi:hypothetical protein